VRGILSAGPGVPGCRRRLFTLFGVSARALVVTLAALALIALLTFGLLTQGAASLEPGDDAPDAELPVLGSDETRSISDYRGDWLLANFWASWCTPCRDESPTLQRFSERQNGEVVVLGIDTQDLSDDAMAFVDEFELTYPMLRDPDTEEPLSDDYGSTGLPESFLIDPEGQVAVICRGPVTAEDLEEVVRPTVEGRAPQGDGSICRAEP
jgi:cytochrome c biogenesis protein CcmG, thiol:disulfide interchange protein DsbE